MGRDLVPLIPESPTDALAVGSPLQMWLKFSSPQVIFSALLSFWDTKKIKPVNPKWNRPWIFIGRADAEAETSILWPPDTKNLLFGKDPVAGKDWRQKKGEVEDKMVRQHHQPNGPDFEQAPADSEGGSGAWLAAVHGVANSWTQLSDWNELDWRAIIKPAVFL